MARGFSKQMNFGAIIGWTLFSVRVFGPHIVLEFNNGYDYLNISYKLQLRDNNGSVVSNLDLIDGVWEGFGLQLLISAQIHKVRILSHSQVDLYFTTGHILSFFDHPSYRSWWFDGKSLVLKGSSLTDFEVEDVPDNMSSFRLDEPGETLEFS